MIVEPAYNTAFPVVRYLLSSLRLVVRTSPSHGGNRGSSPLGSTSVIPVDRQ